MNFEQHKGLIISSTKEDEGNAFKQGTNTSHKNVLLMVIKENKPLVNTRRFVPYNTQRNENGGRVYLKQQRCK